MTFLRTLKVTFRQLLSQKLNTAVHIAGLSLGMTVCLLIGLFIRFELSFDNYHPHAARTYRINEAYQNNGEVNRFFSTPLAMPEALRKTVAGLEHVAFAFPTTSIIDVSADKRFEERNVVITDPEFVEVFKVEAIHGDPKEVLAKPYHALITETIAKKFYGTVDAVGKTFRIQSKFDITVGGVIKDLPPNTHLPVVVLLSYVPDEKFLGGVSPDIWSFTTGSQTYVVLPDGFDQNILQTQLTKLADEHINSNEWMPKFMRAGYEILPLSAIHFDTPSGGSMLVPAASKTWIWFFGGVGIAVLLLACINFVNLSTAQALTRAKEVGIRKTVGAGRLNLMVQFLGEAWTLALISGIIAVGCLQLLMPVMNIVLEKTIPFSITSSPDLILYLAIGIFVVGLLAGIYPAWIITRYNPAISLRSTFSSQGEQSSSWLRRSLVVLQFSVSAGLLIALILISNQVNFIHTKELGFNKDNIILVKTGSGGTSPVLSHELERIPQVEKFSFSTTPPSDYQHWSTMMSAVGKDDPDRQHVNLLFGDENFAGLYGFKLLTGRYPVDADSSVGSRSLPEDQRVTRCVVNEAALKVLDVSQPESAIGKRFWAGQASHNFEIIGVVSDFNSNSLREAIKPVIITTAPEHYGVTSIKIVPGSDITSTIAAIEKGWKIAYPDAVFSYQFLNEQIDSFYKSETRIYSLFKMFSAIAMLISCLGLWGLITFTAQRRLREIGIRKVLGASTSSIMVLLSREFFFMVLIALALATPLVYYGVSQWLNEFAFKVPIGWQAFAVAGSISIALALITVGIQSLRATFTNPASVLKSE